MASLLKPIQKCLLPMKQITKYAMASNIRLASSSTTTSPPAAPTGGDKVDKKKDPTYDPKESYLADPWDILYGNERFEIAMKTKGYNDPYDMEPLLIPKSNSKEQPNVVLTLQDRRLIGCVCNEDTHHINYMWIFKGETKRCECGHWFACKERELPDLSDFGIDKKALADHH